MRAGLSGVLSGALALSVLYAVVGGKPSDVKNKMLDGFLQVPGAIARHLLSPDVPLIPDLNPQFDKGWGPSPSAQTTPATPAPLTSTKATAPPTPPPPASGPILYT